jgi:hypothetical protein
LHHPHEVLIPLPSKNFPKIIMKLFKSQNAFWALFVLTQARGELFLTRFASIEGSKIDALDVKGENTKKFSINK